ncbi:YqiA/YcfP family alpha/beta fold hydrolase [Uliginosibacterium sediminicola]|uniref:YqiA/YcfP family alpha/beta fold hydrolase n=1 Tax=Uliginosibacterium sediminicola TaxID=2024550 RepID=A0ABU9YTJ6_9RHOO
MLIYLHGFRSGPQSQKALSLQQRMDALGIGDQLWAGQLEWGPARTIAQLEQIIAASATPPTLIGSSLGGFYATALAERHGLRAVLVNPAIAPHRLLTQWLGRQTQIYTGASFEVVPAQLEELRSLQVEHFADASRYWLLAETGDEVLDYREAVAYFAGARQTVLTGGDHRFTQWEAYLDAIIAFAGLSPRAR